MTLSVKRILVKLRMRRKGGDKKKATHATRAMTFKASKGPKFILFVGDEGAILTYVIDHVVQSRQFVTDASQQSLKELQQTLNKDPDAPLFMVIDNMDQSYVQQTLPPVSSLSVNKLVKRRLDRDFAESDIKGAILLGREKKGRKDWNFMMVSVERTPQLNVWLEFVESLPNHFKGIHLVAVEAEYLVKYIESATGSKNELPPEWKFVVSHNKVGGFRQVILRNDKVVFTRLAQPIGESSMEMIAGNIEQEMLSTIEYMKRLSYNPQDGLDIYIVASAGIKEIIDTGKFANTVMHILTPFELAEALGIEGATQPTDQFGDVILAAIIGCAKKRVLSLSTPISRQINQYYQMTLLQRVAAGVVAFCIVAYALFVGVQMFSLSQDASALEEDIAKQQNRLNVLRDEIKRSDLDIEKANDLLVLYQQLLKEEISPLPFIRTLYPMRQAPVWIKQVSWKLGNKDNAGLGVFPTGDVANRMYTTMNLEFLNVAADPKGFKVVSKKVLEDLRALFPGYEADYLAIPESYLEKDQMEIKYDDKAAAEVKAPPPVVEAFISGTLLREPLLPADTTNTSPANPQPMITP